MKFCLLSAVLLLVTGALTQEDEFDLFDALDDIEPTPPKPKEQPKAPANPNPDDGLDLFDALGPDEPEPEKPKKPKPNPGDSDRFGFDLEDALKPDPNAKPDKPAVNPPKHGGGGGNFGDKDLFDVSDGDYKPEGGRSGDPGYNSEGGADQPQEAGSGAIAGIVSAIGMALLGAGSSYFAYQKKKLCFKIQGGADPESGKGRHPAQSDPQVFSNLLRTS
ncbi:CD99 molecule isoform X1 [Phyllopteryx taeniolatus]|uniref:CD99 molecule isoform X1 n=1 Tax=Phyllopteryx taeniolatus TaxID=161469 RepID=UPI002AD3F818|nr:CD99 molecule isoform X1 [Phyllopteryx taeniolatus]